MELKDNDLNGEIVLARKFTLSNNIFEKLWKLHSKMNPISCFFQEHAQIAQKTRLFTTFILLIQMLWIKASHVDLNIIYKKKNNII